MDFTVNNASSLPDNLFSVLITASGSTGNTDDTSQQAVCYCCTNDKLLIQSKKLTNIYKPFIRNVNSSPTDARSGKEQTLCTILASYDSSLSVSNNQALSEYIFLPQGLIIYGKRISSQYCTQKLRKAFGQVPIETLLRVGQRLKGLYHGLVVY